MPAPVYPAFVNDFWSRSRVHLHMAQTNAPAYTLTKAILDQAYDACVKAGHLIRTLIIIITLIISHNNTNNIS